MVSSNAVNAMPETLSNSTPTREEWLQRYAWQFEREAISERLSDSASGDEIAAMIAALKRLWSALGKEVRAANNRFDYTTRGIVRIELVAASAQVLRHHRVERAGVERADIVLDRHQLADECERQIDADAGEQLNHGRAHVELDLRPRTVPLKSSSSFARSRR